MTLADPFDTTLVRFAVSGTLILAYSLADGFARRMAPGAEMRRAPAAFWVKVTIVVSITAFYALIGPTGRALAGGVGNVAGVALVGAAIALRLWLQRQVDRIREPETAARLLFYLALPLAVGVPWGWLALTLPAFVASAMNTLREERSLPGRPGGTLARRDRWIPGVW